MIEHVARILRLMDHCEQPVFAFDEVQRWPAGLLDRLVEIGLLHEIEPAELIACNNCDEGHVLEPEIREYPDTGEVAVAKCPTCGRVQFSFDRLKQWGVNGDGLASHFARACTTGRATCLVADRCWWLGSLARDGAYREVFLARGLTWPDAAEVVAQSERLCGSTAPALLVPADVPDISLWKRFIPATAALTEIATLTNAGLIVDWDRLLQIPITPAPNSGQTPGDAGGDPALKAMVLIDAERNVLEALAKDPNTPMTRDELVKVAGHGKDATSAAIKRLLDLGFIARPEGMQRKGVAITPLGIQYLALTGANALDT